MPPAKTRRGQPDKLGSTGVLPEPKQAKPVKAAGLRALFAQVAEEEATLDAVRQIALDALGATASTKCVCPDCGTEFRAPLPDLKKNLDAAIAMLEQIEGRPEQRAPEATVVIVSRPPLPT